MVTLLPNGNGYEHFRTDLLYDTGRSEFCSLWYPSKTYVVFLKGIGSTYHHNTIYDTWITHPKEAQLLHTVVIGFMLANLLCNTSYFCEWSCLFGLKHISCHHGLLAQRTVMYCLCIVCVLFMYYLCIVWLIILSTLIGYWMVDLQRSRF